MDTPLSSFPISISLPSCCQESTEPNCARKWYDSKLSHRLVRLTAALFLLGGLSQIAWAQAVVSFSPTSLNFGSVQVGVTSAPQNIVLTNPGNTTLNVSKIQIASPDATDFSQANNCGKSIAAGSSCTISISFKPTLSGARSANLAVSDNASGSPQEVPLSGTGLAPAVTFVPPSLTFSNQTLGTASSAQTVKITNTGQAPLTISGITVAGANPGDFSLSQTCGSGLSVSASCTLTVAFSPAASWGRTAVIMVADNALGSPQGVGLAGNGVSGGIASFSPSSLTFTARLMGTASVPQSVTLNNTGTAPLAISAINPVGDYTQNNNCPASLPAGISCTINVTFVPSLNGARPGWIDVNLLDPAGVQTIALAGTGALPAPVVVKPRMASLTPAQTLQYTAYLSGTQTTGVTWYVDNVLGGSSAVGTISASGLYTPSALAGTHTVKAVNNANTKQSASVPVVVSGYSGTLTYHNDNLRTGENSSENALTTGNVNPTQFGKLFSYPVDGQIYGEPLWVPNLSINGVSHNVIFVATQNDSVYAFDADNAALYPNALWHASFIKPPGVTAIPRDDVERGMDISPQIGITSTPVIDAALGVIFVEARTLDTTGTPNCKGSVAPQYFHFLHALNIATGTEMPGSPVMICAQVPGSGYDNVNGTVTFNPQRQNNRSGLLLLNGVVYIAFASLEDISPYHGWVFGYDESSLAQVSVFNNTPNGNKGGIWHGGGGIPADAEGNLYTTSGSGSVDPNVGGGMTFAKLIPSGNTLSVTDYFSPYNNLSYENMESTYADLSSSGPLLLPDQSGQLPHLAVICGKTGTIYLVNRDNMGHSSSNSDNVVQALYTTIGANQTPSGNWGTPAYFNGNIYMQGVKDFLKQFTLSNSLLSGGPVALSSDLIGYPGSVPVVSSNGTQNGIVWLVQSDGSGNNKPATLRAYDANDVSHELYNSGQSGKRDIAGAAVKFSTPTVANGKVYVNTATELDVYGLLP
jgi:hypothetical protein